MAVEAFGVFFCTLSRKDQCFSTPASSVRNASAFCRCSVNSQNSWLSSNAFLASWRRCGTPTSMIARLFQQRSPQLVLVLGLLLSPLLLLLVLLEIGSRRRSSMCLSGSSGVANRSGIFTVLAGTSTCPDTSCCCRRTGDDTLLMLLLRFFSPWRTT